MYNNNNNNFPFFSNPLGSLISRVIIIIIIMEFLRELGRRLGSLSGEERESCFLFQRLSVAIQRFNSVLLHNGFTDYISDL